MPPATPSLYGDLVLRMVVLRRMTVAVGGLALLAQRVATGAPLFSGPVEAMAAAVLLVNEAVRWLFGRIHPDRFLTVVNAQVALDVAVLTGLLHFGGGITSPGVLIFAPPFFVYGAVLPLAHAFAHVAAAMVELSALALAESTGLLAHYATGFYAPDTYQRSDFVALTIIFVSVVNALSASMSHYLRVLLRVQEERSSALAAERGALLAQNEREAARVRALLDVAQHVSGTHSVGEFLGAVCDTTVALARVPRVEVFLWDEDAECLRLAATRGSASDPHREDVRYPAHMPIVAQLRAGDVVDFGAFPSHSLVEGRVQTPFRRAFAAPLVCRGAFQGALFVGYDDENTDEFMELILGIARQAALALANVRTMEQQQEDAEVSNILLQVSQALSACLDEEALWRLVARAAGDVLGVPWAVACRFDERANSLTVAGVQGLPETVPATFGQARFLLDETPVLKDLQGRREVVVAEPTDSCELIAAGGWEAGTWIAIPLVRGNWVAGLLLAGHFGQRRSHTPRRQLRLADGLGHHASIAMQNARMVADLEAADKLKSEFVSTMSHELRTPLNVIIGYTEMLREGAVGPVSTAQLELVNRLDARGRELLELIEATLHVGRLEAGRAAVELAPVDFQELLQAFNAGTAGLPRPAGVEFEWEVPPNARDKIVTDRAKLSLVVRNLVSNAFKFTSEGKVLVRLLLHGDTLVVEVKDTGIGIRAEHLPIIFDMFRQVDGSMTRRHGGVGLGLYIVKQFVGRLGGTVDVTSTPGKGTTFRVVLPGVIREERRASFRAA